MDFDKNSYTYRRPAESGHEVKIIFVRHDFRGNNLVRRQGLFVTTNNIPRFSVYGSYFGFTKGSAHTVYPAVDKIVCSFSHLSDMTQTGQMLHG